MRRRTPAPSLSGARLSRLRRRIIDEWTVRGWKDVWFYPEADGVKGWNGTRALFLIGLNPSTGSFPTARDAALYKALSRYGLQNVHLTDVIKLRAKGKTLADLARDPAVMSRQKRYFLEEIAILQPTLLIPMGWQAATIVRQWVPEAIDIRPIPHYANRFDIGAHRFKRALRNLARRRRAQVRRANVPAWGKASAR